MSMPDLAHPVYTDDSGAGPYVIFPTHAHQILSNCIHILGAFRARVADEVLIYHLRCLDPLVLLCLAYRGGERRRTAMVGWLDVGAFAGRSRIP